MNIVQVIVPYAGKCSHRAHALEWVRRQLGYSMVLARGGEPWSKGAALWPALRSSHADIVVLHDADVWTDGLADAVQAVQDGASWAMPHKYVFRLTRASSERLMDGELLLPSGRERPGDQLRRDAQRVTVAGAALDHPVYEGIWGGGIVVARREVLLDVPVDPRFTVWGQEDESHAVALQEMHGPGWRGIAPLVHLWHPPSPRLNQRIGSEANWQLRGRYFRARSDRARMIDLLREAHVTLQAPQERHAHHDRGLAPVG